ncbi:protein translocase subunit [Exophiala xenobiotica]|nr:protein translocase subunit [Exophiala xenobiotica]
MAFGGLFGDSSSPSSSPFGSPLPTSASPSGGSATLQNIQTAITQQSAVANARFLIAKVNENCFDHCVPNPPGSSLSSSEHKCLTACMEKYFDGWNVVHRSYVTRMQKEGASMVGNATAGPAGKELF